MEDLPIDNIMESKRSFISVVDQILANHSGWSGVSCQTCGKETTRAQYDYSIRFYKKPLCRLCQSLEKFNYAVPTNRR